MIASGCRRLSPRPMPLGCVGHLLIISRMCHAPLPVLARDFRLGHAVPAITLRVYAHVIHSAETAAAEVFA